jgi:diadenosine tetraphosphate (Ap4A) HIT family hydrolase
MECRFCKLLTDDNNETLIATLKYGRLFLNYNQCFAGRVMYIYNKHLGDVSEIDIKNHFAVDKEIVVIAKVIKRIFRADLINVASLGNHVQHLHWHIIPRYKDDPSWGQPPWPHGDKKLTESEQTERCLFIREALFADSEFIELNAVEHINDYVS